MLWTEIDHMFIRFWNNMYIALNIRLSRISYYSTIDLTVLTNIAIGLITIQQIFHHIIIFFPNMISTSLINLFTPTKRYVNSMSTYIYLQTYYIY